MSETGMVLLVDDDPDHLFLVERYLALYGFPYKTAANGAEALKILKQEDISVVVTDMVMPGMDGMELLQETREKYPKTDVMVMTGYSKLYSFSDVISAGAVDFISKPFQRDEFFAKINRIFRERALLRELREAKEQTEVASRAKNDFLHTIRHELLTPMNSIIGFSDLLRSASLPAEEKGYADLVAQSAERLMKLINQILDFSAIEMGKSETSPAHFQLTPLLEDLLLKYRENAEKKGLVLSLRQDEELKDVLLFGDQFILQQILNNLIDNALKFTDNGSVEVTAGKLRELTEDNIEMRFTVSDTGCGVALKKLGKIFEPFTQADEYMTRRHKGAGLGLASCARLVKLLDGEMHVESKQDIGSTFSFTVQMIAA